MANPTDENTINEYKAIKKVFFWEKWASQPQNELDDSLESFDVINDPKIREVIRGFELKNIGKKMLFNEVRPKNASVKEWIQTIMFNYPNKMDKEVEYLINTFRESLFTRSKEAQKNIVCLLLLNDTLLLYHCRKDPSLVEWNEEIIPVDQILNSRNVYRAAIVKNENGILTFSAYEYNRKWSKGHAKFWQIPPESIAWDTLGEISLIIKLKNFEHLMVLPLENEDLDKMIIQRKISPTGNITINDLEGNIIKVKIFRSELDFPKFYDFYLTGKEKLAEHRQKFNGIISSQKEIVGFSTESKNKYRYFEDIINLYEVTAEEEKLPIHKKAHITYDVVFFTNHYPGIKPNNEVIYKIYNSIFCNDRLRLWHAGEESSNDPVIIGCLEVYNNLEISRELMELSCKLIDIIQDARAKKEYYILQFYFCALWKQNLKNGHFATIFDHIIESIIIPELQHAFESKGVYSTEGHIDFKSAEQYISKPKRFVNEKLLPIIKTYTAEGLTRFGIIYGIEDNGTIKPLYHLKSDQVTAIQDEANKQLMADNYQIRALAIPFNTEKLLAVFVLPIIKSDIIRIKDSLYQNERDKIIGEFD